MSPPPSRERNSALMTPLWRLGRDDASAPPGWALSSEIRLRRYESACRESHDRERSMEASRREPTAVAGPRAAPRFAKWVGPGKPPSG